jgi:signal transduction histidine kinase
VRLLGRLGTTRLDAALAAAFLVVGLAQVIVFPIADGVIGEVFVVGTTLPLAWRRTRPIESTLVMGAFFLVPTDGYAVAGFVVIILQLFALGTHGEPTRAVAATVGFASVTSVIGTFLGPEEPVTAIGGVLVVVGPVLAGRLVRHLRHQNDELIRLAAELREERGRAEEAAVGAERARIAQELHDVVGHEVTLIAIQAEAASAALRLSPDRAAEPVEAIRTTAHRTLTEIRSVLDLLAPVADSLPATAAGTRHDAAPSPEDLASLSRRARGAGITNTVTETGTPLPDHAPVSLAVRRIVRECLTNAGRHAPGEALDVAVTWGEDAVEVRATNPTPTPSPTPMPTPSAPGRGLTGMRHRTELLGGIFAADVTDGVFAVRVRIPTGDRP